jgi:Rad3-related DNA helicase
LEHISLAKGVWVVEQPGRGYRFTPLWVADFGQADLFQSVPKVMLMSAILSPKSLDLLGVPSDKESRSWLEVPSYFPAANTPIWHIPTARINYRTDDYGAKMWLTRIDQIISRRLDRKGIIFTVSYARRDFLIQNSDYKNIMISHSTGDVTAVVNKFKTMKAPAVLVSPSVTTGFDFPSETGCKYIIVGKIPYPDTVNPVMKARQEVDPDWSSFQAMGTLIQESGRASREMTGKCEVLIVDDSWYWFYGRYKQFSPAWFQARVRGTMQNVPNPLV